MLTLNRLVIREPNASEISSGVHFLDDHIRSKYVPVAEFGDYEIREKGKVWRSTGKGRLRLFHYRGVLLGVWAVQRRRPWLLSVALTLLMNKPQEVLLVTPFLLWSARGWRRARPLNRYTVALSVTIGIVASSYVTDNYLVLPLALAWPVLLDESPGWAAVCYAATLSPLARLTGSVSYNWLDGVFPLVTLLALLSMYRQPWTRVEAGAVETHT